MFRPRHAYRSPITHRYKGKAHGCPVFNNLNKINSDIVEHHDECLECLSTIKNHKELYRSLLENNRPSNNVIRSLQRLSSSATDNRLKMCLQLLTIKVNESKQPKDNVVETHQVDTHHVETTKPCADVHRIDPQSVDTHRVEAPRVNTHHVDVQHVNTNGNANTNNDNHGSNLNHSSNINHNNTNHKNNNHNNTNHNSNTNHNVSSSPPSFMNDLKGPRLKLSEKVIRRILKRPLIFDDLEDPNNKSNNNIINSNSNNNNCINNDSQQPLDLVKQTNKKSNNSMRTGMSVFQSAPIFVNNLNLKTSAVAPTNGNVDTGRRQQQNPPSKKQDELGQELLKCAICGIQQRPPMITKIYGQNSCRICSEFFEAFMEWPKQFYCAQDGDCLMTFDSRCRACWIKICLQKFDTDEEYRKIGHKFSPKLLSSPNVSLITIDTSLSNGSPLSNDQPCSTTSRTTPSTLSPGPQSLLMVASSSPAPGSVGTTTKKKVKTKKKSKSKRLISLNSEQNNNMKQTNIGCKSINSKKKKTKSSINRVNNIINDDKNRQLKTNCISIQTDPVIDGPVALY